MTISKEYSFIQSKFPLFEEYLALSGWRMYSDRTLAVIYVRNIEGFNKLRLDKLTTLIIIRFASTLKMARLARFCLNKFLRRPNVITN